MIHADFARWQPGAGWVCRLTCGGERHTIVPLTLAGVVVCRECVPRGRGQQSVVCLGSEGVHTDRGTDRTLWANMELIQTPLTRRISLPSHLIHGQLQGNNNNNRGALVKAPLTPQYQRRGSAGDKPALLKQGGSDFGFTPIEREEVNQSQGSQHVIYTPLPNLNRSHGSNSGGRISNRSSGRGSKLGRFPNTELRSQFGPETGRLTCYDNQDPTRVDRPVARVGAQLANLDLTKSCRVTSSQPNQSGTFYVNHNDGGQLWEPQTGNFTQLPDMKHRTVIFLPSLEGKR